MIPLQGGLEFPKNFMKLRRKRGFILLEILLSTLIITGFLVVYLKAKHSLDRTEKHLIIKEHSISPLDRLFIEIIDSPISVLTLRDDVMMIDEGGYWTIQVNLKGLKPVDILRLE